MLRRTALRPLSIATALAACTAVIAGCGSSAQEAATASGGATPEVTNSSEGGYSGEAMVKTGISYASTSPSQTLDLYLPEGDGEPLPVVLLIHGGAFKMGSSQMERANAEALVAAGFAAVAVNYRLSGEALFPAGAQDVKAAVRWVRANAATYGLDADAIGAWGESAGGWMANMLGVTGDQETVFDDDSLGNAGQSDAVQAVVSWFGPTNFATMDEQAAEVAACGGSAEVHSVAGSPESTWLGGALAAKPAETGQANLGAYAATAGTLPAFYFAHGDADCNVPLGQSEELMAAVQSAGGSASLSVLSGARHADPAFQSTQTEPTIAFLTATLAG